MKLRILILLCSMSFALMASAQASGGQIRRSGKKQRKAGDLGTGFKLREDTRIKLMRCILLRGY